jgi:hypothetical protein
MDESNADKNLSIPKWKPRAKRGTMMIFVAFMMVAVTTILAASSDLSRIARVRQAQTEREIKWNLAVESAKALAVEGLSTSMNSPQTFSATVNNIPLTIQSELSSSWSNGNGAKVTVSGTLAGKPRQTDFYLGKRSIPNPAVFGCFVTSFFAPNNFWGDKETLRIVGDLYCPKRSYLRGVEVSGDLYSSLRAQPTLESLGGSFFGYQPGMSIGLDSAKYSPVADVSTTGDLVLNSPTNSASGTRSKLFYHKGTLTIKGTVTGEITIYVSGNAIIQNPKLATSRDRLVVIVDGDVEVAKGTSEVFLISNGEATFTDSGSRTIKGSLACATLKSLSDNITVDFDSYFVNDPVRSAKFRIPGQW